VFARHARVLFMPFLVLLERLLGGFRSPSGAREAEVAFPSFFLQNYAS
jgi:hypothetical protein